MADKLVQRKNIKTKVSLSHSQDDKDKLAQYLDYEIELIRNEIQQPGWTKWAVSGSLAAVGWLMIDEFEKGGFLLNTILIWLIVISLVVDVVSMFSSLINEASSLSGFSKSRFFITSQLVGSNRLSILFYDFRFLSMLLFFSMVVPQISRFVSSIFYLFYGYLALVYIAILFLSFLRIPLPMSNSLKGGMKNQKVFAWILLLVGILSFVGILQIIPAPSGALAEFRLACLVAIAYYLLYLIVRVGNTSPLMSSLIEIRRGLLFDRIDYEFAKEQAEVAIIGLKLSHVLQKYVGDLMALYEDMNNEIRAVTIQVNAVDKILKNSKGKLSEEDKEIFTSLMASAKIHVREATKIVSKKIPSAYSPLKWRLDFMKKISDVDSDDVNAVYEVISSANKKAEDDLRKLDTRLGKLLKTFDKFFPLDTNPSPS